MNAQTNPAERRRARIWLMINAYLMFHARKYPRAQREHEAWHCLLQWAALGGLPTEVITK